MIRYVTSGESHGKQLTVIIEGLPAGLKITAEEINADLARRQQGYGRGERMKIEKDTAEIVSGVRLGETIGSPVTLVIKNRDWENWTRIMQPEPGALEEKDLQVRPRPGHADLPGILKYDRSDIRDILERASARETAARVAAGAVFRKLLGEFDIAVFSYVREIGGVRAAADLPVSPEAIAGLESSPVRTPDPEGGRQMMEAIDRAKGQGDTLGGIFSVVVRGAPVGLGSHVQWDARLDGRLAQSLMSIQAVKGVEFGLGFAFAATPGSGSHDELHYAKDAGFFRETNRAGGLEGGITNGEDIVVSCVMKPIPSLVKPLGSVNIRTKEPGRAEAVRSDVCAVPAAGIVGEAVVSFEIARALREKFGGDSLADMKSAGRAYRERIKKA